MESVIFLASLVVKKGIVCLPLPEKRTGETAWVVAFFDSCRLLAGSDFRAAVSNGLADHAGLRYVCNGFLFTYFFPLSP